MRRLLISSIIVALAACTRPQAPVPQTPSAPVVAGQAVGPIIGLAAADLISRLGVPALQIREGNSVKLQFRNPSCVLDAYLYPPPGAAAPYRVTYVDTRSPSLAEVSQDACLRTFDGP